MSWICIQPSYDIVHRPTAKPCQLCQSRRVVRPCAAQRACGVEHAVLHIDDSSISIPIGVIVTPIVQAGDGGRSAVSETAPVNLVGDVIVQRTHREQDRVVASGDIGADVLRLARVAEVATEGADVALRAEDDVVPVGARATITSVLNAPIRVVVDERRSSVQLENCEVGRARSRRTVQLEIACDEKSRPGRNLQHPGPAAALCDSQVVRGVVRWRSARIAGPRRAHHRVAGDRHRVACGRRGVATARAARWSPRPCRVPVAGGRSGHRADIRRCGRIGHVRRIRRGEVVCHHKNPQPDGTQWRVRIGEGAPARRRHRHGPTRRAAHARRERPADILRIIGQGDSLSSVKGQGRRDRTGAGSHTQHASTAYAGVGYGQRDAGVDGWIRIRTRHAGSAEAQGDGSHHVGGIHKRERRTPVRWCYRNGRGPWRSDAWRNRTTL